MNCCALQLDSLGLKSSFLVAEYTVTSGALRNVDLINNIFDHLEEGDAFQNIDEFFWRLIQFEVRSSL